MINLDNNAEIKPNIGLGGINLRCNIYVIESLITSNGEKVGISEIRYQFGSGQVLAGIDSRNNKVFKLTALNGYTGKLFGKIYVGMKVRDAFNLEPSLYYDEAEELILCNGVLGVSIEVPEVDPLPSEVADMTIYSISVYADETRTLRGQEGNW